jgi:hypothetical protein
VYQNQPDLGRISMARGGGSRPSTSGAPDRGLVYIVGVWALQQLDWCGGIRALIWLSHAPGAPSGGQHAVHNAAARSAACQCPSWGGPSALAAPEPRCGGRSSSVSTVNAASSLRGRPLPAAAAAARHHHCVHHARRGHPPAHSPTALVPLEQPLLSFARRCPA